MVGKEVTTDEVADRISELILSQTYISKDQLKPKINSFLKAFVKIQSIPKLFPKDLKMTEILKRKTESAMYNEISNYYARELCKIVGAEKMKEYNKGAEIIRKTYNGNPIELINNSDSF